MCGIAGFSGARIVSPARVGAMLRALAARGPDASHAATWDGARRPTDGEAHHALLATRLAIIDPRPIADQPMGNDAGDIWIAYNGEVYGWQEDARGLERQGVCFRTRSDTEFILRAYEAWGIGMLDKLRGMFAIAVMDFRRGILTLIRDRLGLKPVVYAHAPGEFAFASTVRALLPFLPPERKRLSPEGIDAYLAHRYVPSPRTVFRDIRRLANGHYLEYDMGAGTIRESTYWRPQPEAHDWRDALDESVRLRTVADRPVGIFLSGGVDSAVIATRLVAQGHTDVRSYTATFPGEELDEGPDAARIAARLGLPHSEVPIPRSIRDSFSSVVADLDEPFADPSAFPMWYLSQAATRQVKVVLAGEGGDELFGGYKRYAVHRRSAWRRGFRLPGLDGGRLPSHSKLRMELSLSWEDAYSLRFSGFSPFQRAELQPDLRGFPAVYWREPDVRHGTDPLQTMLAIDMANYLPEYILRKGDLTTMAHGLELRAPFLDHRLYRRVIAMPAAERFTRPAKVALQPVCGPCKEFGLFRRPKRGFNPPLERWLAGLSDRLDVAGDALEASTASQICADAVHRLVQRHRAGEKRLAEGVLQLAILAESLQQLKSLSG